VVVPLQTPRPAQELTREFAIKGGLKLSLDEILYPVRIISDRKRKFAAGQVTVPAAVGFRSEIALVNSFTPEADQDGEILLHAIWINSVSGIAINAVWPTVPTVGLTDVPDKRFLDGGVSAAPQGILGFDNTAAATAGVAFMQWAMVGATESFHVDFDPHPLVVPSVAPRTIIIRPAGDNQQIAITMLWSEPADPA